MFSDKRGIDMAARGPPLAAHVERYHTTNDIYSGCFEQQSRKEGEGGKDETAKMEGDGAREVAHSHPLQPIGDERRELLRGEILGLALSRSPLSGG